jgi:hypothetical protein
VFFECKLTGIDGHYLFYRRELFFQQLFCPQTEGEFTASVQTASNQPQRHAPALFINLQQFSMPFGEVLQPGLELGQNFNDPALQCHQSLR